MRSLDLAYALLTPISQNVVMAKPPRRPKRELPRQTWHGADVEQYMVSDFRRYQARRRYREYAPYVFVWLVASAGFWAALTAWEEGAVNPQQVTVEGRAHASSASDKFRADFGLCHTGGGINCVVDGDTIWFEGERVRVADIDAPETHPPRCAEEADLGERATARLHQLMNAGAFSLKQIERDTDVYGRKLRIVVRNGESLGEVLVEEGLARRYEGGRRPWCGSSST